MANALKFRDYRLLWVGSLISNIGEGMRDVAEDWLVFVMTGSPFLLGVVSFCKGPPRLLLGPIFGVIVDRLNRKWVMIGAQLLHLVVTLAFAILVTTRLIEFWHIVVLAITDALVAPIIRVTRQTLIPNLVPRESLLNALSLQSVGAHTSHMVGPFVGGILIVWIGVDGVLYIIALSFCAIIVSLLMMHIPQRAGELPELRIVKEIGEGLRFVKGSPAVFNAMVMQFFCFFFILPFNRLLPVYAKDILEIGPTGLGLLRGCFAGGNVFGGLGLVSVGAVKNKEGLLLVASFLMTGFLILFSHATWLPLSLIFLIAVGASSMVFRVTALSLIQLNVPDGLRGRVMGLHNLESGFRSFGGLLYGASASFWGTPVTLSMGGAIFSLLAFVTHRYGDKKRRETA